MKVKQSRVRITTETVDDNGETDMEPDESDERIISEIVLAGSELTEDNKFTEMIVDVSEFVFLSLLLLLYYYIL